MSDLFKRLFVMSEDASTGISSSGLVSPYIKNPSDILAIAIDEIESEIKSVGYVIAKAHAKCDNAITLLKKINPAGFLEFRSRVIDTFELNKVLPDNESLQTQLAEVLAVAYAKISDDNAFLVYDSEEAAKKVASATITTAKKLGLALTSLKIVRLLEAVLLTVLYVPKKPNPKEAKKNAAPTNKPAQK